MTKLRVLVACEFDGYAVSPDGTVYSRRTARGLRSEYRRRSPSVDGKGYLGLTLCGPNGVRRKVRIHRLVAETFIPNPNNLPCVRHLDGNCRNNHVSNLAWGTYADNEQDKKRHGTYDLRRNGKLSDADRRAIRSLAAIGHSQKEIASRFGVSRPTITRLLNGATWGDCNA